MSSKMINVQMGMNEQELVQVMGAPTSVSATENRKIYNYKLYTTTSSAISDNQPEDFYIVFSDGVVSSFGEAEVLNVLQNI